MMGKSHDECMIELLQKRPGVAAEMLKLAIEEDTTEELRSIVQLINAAGYDVSVTAKPLPAPRKRTKATAAKTKPRKQAKNLPPISIVT